MAYITTKKGSSGKPSPYYQAVLYIKGKQYWRSTKCTNKTKANAVGARWTRAVWLATRNELLGKREELLREIQLVTDDCPPVLQASTELFNELIELCTGRKVKGENLEEYLHEWLALKRPELRPASFKAYNTGIEKFLESLAPKRRTQSVASITPLDISDHQQALLASGLGGATINCAYMASVRGAFLQAQRDGIIITNPCGAAKRLSEQKSESRIPFTHDQLRALLAACDDFNSWAKNSNGSEWKGMVLVGAFCGMRMGDASHLKWSNVFNLEDEGKRCFRYEQEKTAHRAKEDKRITEVYMHEQVAEYLLTEAPMLDRPDAAIFPGLNMIPRRNRTLASQDFARLMKAAGVKPVWGAEKQGKGRQFKKLSYHSLRHTFVSELQKKGVSVDVRKAVAGHSSDAAHEKYTHLSLSSQRAGISLLERI